MMTSGHDTHAEEWKSAEPSGEDQPEVDLSGDGDLHGGVPDGMTEEDVEGRSPARGLPRPRVWPATGEQLLEVARGREAPRRRPRPARRLPRRPGLRERPGGLDRARRRPGAAPLLDPPPVRGPAPALVLSHYIWARRSSRHPFVSQTLTGTSGAQPRRPRRGGQMRRTRISRLEEHPNLRRSSAVLAQLAQVERRGPAAAGQRVVQRRVRRRRPAARRSPRTARWSARC